MRDNSGGGKSSNNSGDPTLKVHARARDVSGQAITGEQTARGSDRKRTEPRDSGGLR